jgi:hypothetical protein
LNPSMPSTDMPVRWSKVAATARVLAVRWPLLYERSANRHSILSQPKRRDSRVAIYVEVIKIARIKNRVAQITKNRAVEVI